MTRGCLDEGLLQAYIDGELSQVETSEAASHIAACESCAVALATAESEAAFFSSAFAPDDSVSVPTEALRARIDDAVARLESTTDANQGRSRGWNFGGFFASLSALFDFTPQRAAAFASIIAVVAVALVYFAINRQPNEPVVSGRGEIAQAAASAPASTPATPNEIENSGDGAGKVTSLDVDGNHSKKPAVVPASYRHRRVGEGGLKSPVEHTKAPEPLPGEKDYQTAIASLEKTIKLGGDTALRPAVRVDYERNLAILDNAIAQTRQVAAKNPKDKDAVGFLMSAYQSKVELLTSVADQAQVAALGR